MELQSLAQHLGKITPNLESRQQLQNNTAKFCSSTKNCHLFWINNWIALQKKKIKKMVLKETLKAELWK